MRNKGYELLRKCQFPLLMATGLMGVVLYIYGLQGIPLAWVIPCLYLAFGLGIMAVPRKLRWFLGAGGAAALAAFGMQLPGGTVSMLCGVVFAAVNLLSVPMANMEWQEELPKGLYWAGLAAHGTCYVLAAIKKYEGTPLPDYTSAGMGICFLCFVLLAMLGLNRSALGHAALWRHRAPPTVRRRNLLLILSYFLLTGLVAFAPALSNLLYLGFRWLIGWLTNLIRQPAEPYYTPVEDITLPNNPVPETIFQSDTDRVDRLDPGGVPWANEKSDTLLPWIFMVFVLTLIVLAIPPLLRLLSKLLKGLVTPTQEGYVDEITAIHPDKAKKAAVSKRRETVFGKLTPTQKIRRRYAKLMKKMSWGASRTARENLPQDTAVLYEHARYSGQDATAQQAEQFLQQTKT